MVLVLDRVLLRSSGTNTRGLPSNKFLTASRWGYGIPHTVIWNSTRYSSHGYRLLLSNGKESGGLNFAGAYAESCPDL